jgi:hypothetical protein
LTAGVLFVIVAVTFSSLQRDMARATPNAGVAGLLLFFKELRENSSVDGEPRVSASAEGMSESGQKKKAAAAGGPFPDRARMSYVNV